MSDDIEKHVLKKYEVVAKLGKGVCRITYVSINCNADGSTVNTFPREVLSNARRLRVINSTYFSGIRDSLEGVGPPE